MNDVDKNIINHFQKLKKDHPLGKLIHNDFFVNPSEYCKDYYSFFIEENQKSAKLKKLILKIRKSSKSLVFQFCAESKFSNYFCGQESYINKTCDFIVLTPKDCFIIDLKSDCKTTKNAKFQLFNSKLFLEYFNILSSFYFDQQFDFKNIYCLFIKTEGINSKIKTPVHIGKIIEAKKINNSASIEEKVIEKFNAKLPKNFITKEYIITIDTNNVAELNFETIEAFVKEYNLRNNLNIIKC